MFDLKSRELVYEELVAHGQGSGANMATQFSNEDESHQTSLGLFVTRDTYVGKNGYSLRLDGLDRGVNDRAIELALATFPGGGHGAVPEIFVRFEDLATADRIARLATGAPIVTGRAPERRSYGSASNTFLCLFLRSGSVFAG